MAGNLCSAQDGNPNFPTVSITSEIISVNERVSSDFGTGVGLLLAVVSGSDPDGDTLYFALSGSQAAPFTLVANGDGSSNLVNVRTFDYEDPPLPMVTTYTFEVIAYDRPIGDPEALSVFLTVVVRIVDLNDNAPVYIPLPPYRVSLLENKAIGSNCIRVNATDADSRNNGQFQFFLHAGNTNNAFAINRLSGQITVAGTLNYETTVAYVLTVRCTDRGTPPLSTDATVIFNITDVNDSPPVFTQTSYSFGLLENAILGSTGTTISLTDADTPPNAVLTLQVLRAVDDVPSDVFQAEVVNPTTFAIKLRKLLNREVQAIHTLVLVASDGVNTVRASLAATVLDVNDHSPQFDLVRKSGRVVCWRPQVSALKSTFRLSNLTSLAYITFVFVPDP